MKISSIKGHLLIFLKFNILNCSSLFARMDVKAACRFLTAIEKILNSAKDKISHNSAYFTVYKKPSYMGKEPKSILVKDLTIFHSPFSLFLQLWRLHSLI